MRRLYLRIYLAMLASLAIFAVLAAIGWKASFDRERASRDERVLVAEVVGAILPPADAPPDVQRAALERWHARTGADLALFDAQGRPTPNFAKALFNMAAVEIGPLRATQALVDAAVASMAARTAGRPDER